MRVVLHVILSGKIQNACLCDLLHIQRPLPHPRYTAQRAIKWAFPELNCASHILPEASPFRMDRASQKALLFALQGASQLFTKKYAFC